MTDLRTTQAIVEILTQPAAPAARATQAVVEILAGTTAVTTTATTQTLILMP